VKQSGMEQYQTITEPLSQVIKNLANCQKKQLQFTFTLARVNVNKHITNKGCV
jgi:hypothetical protein